MRQTLIDIALSLLWVVLQTTLISHLNVGTVVPDIVLIWIVYLGITRGHAPAATAGFFLGLMLDLLSGPDGMLGLSSLSKSVAGFVSGYAFNENKTHQTLGGTSFVFIILAVSLVHNLLYFLIFLQGSDLPWNRAVLAYGIPTSLYTAAAGLVPMFVFARKYKAGYGRSE
jgi:rod shape-determining protein MreD